MTNSLNMIVAIGRNNVIGRGGDLIWHLPEDLKFFKATTMGHPIIMGRRTWQSFPKAPLPGRHNIVITRQPDFTAEGATVVHSLQEALDAAGDNEPFIIGGGQLYAEALPMATRLIITRIDAECPDADTFFPSLIDDDWEVEMGQQQESRNGLRYRNETRTKKRHRENNVP